MDYKETLMWKEINDTPFVLSKIQREWHWYRSCASDTNHFQHYRWCACSQEIAAYKSTSHCRHLRKQSDCVGPYAGFASKRHSHSWRHGADHVWLLSLLHVYRTAHDCGRYQHVWAGTGGWTACTAEAAASVYADTNVHHDAYTRLQGHNNSNRNTTRSIIVKSLPS